METCGTTVTVVGLEVGQWWCRGQTDRDGCGMEGGVGVRVGTQEEPAEEAGGEEE